MNSRIIYTPQIRERSHKLLKKRIRGVLILAVLVIFLGGGIYLLRLPFWQIKKIELSGLKILEEDKVRASIMDALQGNRFFLIPNSSFLFVGYVDLNSYIKSKFPRVESASINRKFPDTLKIFLQEREFWAVFCSAPQGSSNLQGVEISAPSPIFQKKCVYLDRSGFAFDDAPNSSGSLILKVASDLPEVDIGNYYLGAELIAQMNELAGKFREAAGVEIVGFKFLSNLPSEIRAMTSEGFEIQAKGSDDPGAVARALRTVLDQEVKDKRPQLEYVDLRFGNKVFYMVKPR